MRHEHNMNIFAKVLILALFFSVHTHAQESTTFSEALINGRYLEIHDKSDAKRDGEWAWARFFLKHDAEAFKAAKQAHKDGDILGTFILLKCYRNGVGVKKDDVVKEQLNQLLKQKLTGLRSVSYTHLTLPTKA